tara:strand:+ start:4453 stop:6102 length:1650 start_codon:yes stop_codon:yes gene_type:complete
MKFSFISIFLFMSFYSLAEDLKVYEKVHSKFRSEVCSRGTVRKYFDLLSLTRKTGNYLPINDGKLNTFVVQKNLILLRQKKSWITKAANKINNSVLKELLTELQELSVRLDEIVLLKQEHWLEKEKTKQSSLMKKSKTKVMKFEERLNIFFDRLFMLQTFGYPVNHLEMRGKYDSLKIRKDTLGKNLAQDLFFKRKIYEDGAPHPRWRGTDKSLRTLINTLKSGLSSNANKSFFISETLRYDLVWLFERLEKYLSYDASLIKRMLSRWGNKISDQILFYNQLLSGKVKINGRDVKVDDFIRDNLGAKSRLENFIYSKQADTYEFWSKQSEELRRLFVSETIILNEVGGTPDPGDIEKKEVLKVVHKRSKLRFYSSLGNTKELIEKLNKRGVSTNGKKWLNTLFKKGEFSFTYYFIPGTRHVFCPDMSKKAKGIREVALNIALDLKGKNFNLPSIPIRYFSRQSMLGRIDMSKLWKSFTPLPEEPGPKLEEERRKNISESKSKYLYSFTSSSNKLFDVFSGESFLYVKHNKTGEYFSYRNPNFFKYFIEK